MITKANLDSALAKLEDKIERRMDLHMGELRQHMEKEIKNLDEEGRMVEKLAFEGEGPDGNWKERFEMMEGEVREMKNRIAVLEAAAEKKDSGQDNFFKNDEEF